MLLRITRIYWLYFPWVRFIPNRLGFGLFGKWYAQRTLRFYLADPFLLTKAEKKTVAEHKKTRNNQRGGGLLGGPLGSHLVETNDFDSKPFLDCMLP